MEFCKVNVTFESAVKMLRCGHLHRMLFLFQNFTKGNLEIWSKLAFSKFGTNHIIDQKQQHPCDIAPFSTSDKPVHPVMSKTKKQQNQKKTTLRISPILHQLQLFITYSREETNHESIAFPYLSREQFSDTRD